MRRSSLLNSSPLKFSVLLCIVALSACEASYTLKETQRYLSQSMVTDYYEIDRQHKHSLNADSNFYIARNISEGNQLAQQRVTDNIKVAFDHYFNSASVAAKNEDLQQALRTARHFQTQYLIFPTLQIWNDNIKRWQDFHYGQVASKQIRHLGVRPGGSGPRKWAVNTSKKMQSGSAIKRMRLTLKFIDTVSEKQIDNIVLTSRAGLLSFSDNRPLERLGEPLMTLAKNLSGR